jgi:hypothetical protein
VLIHNLWTAGENYERFNINNSNEKY